ncbi:hypothetical protein PHYSODRAFT_261739 [Phytophthora sojae]|uniref:Uncharacterized protein n=1 Tax=Phytophthora sojae (strain P6497) TaxID=1094619 RepID=G5A091_PHYSP|nr:hypothetical protein PHYSODRAFT_261739 [Phytophthora sojae]EGZ10480.1 hypothetical protein PHYSODRAFT_261739 [Phytophthora sojae]|eukprot:XP_009533225.1 hypothetical protein PHYSODRAFT_261739 [Phytophthora sojae]
MPPKRSARSAKSPSKPRAVGPKTRAAKAKDESSALMEATKAAEEVVRSRSSTPESGRQAGARSKSPDAAQGKEESPRGHKSPARDWEAAVFDCTMVQYSGESSPDDENVSEGSTHAAEGTELAAGDMTNASADAKASSEKEAEDAEFGSGDSKQSHDEVAMADAGVVAEKSPSDAGSKPKEVLASKHLALAQGRERAQASKAAAAAKTAEAKAKKRSASRSPRGSSSKLFIDSESEDEEGAVHEPKELSNNLDEQQQQYHAASSGAYARQPTATTAIESSSGGDATYPQGYFPPEPGTGAPALLEKLSAPRGLIGGYTSRGSYERALVEKSHSFLATLKSPDLFWRYVQRKGYSDQEFKELREHRTLSAILDVRELLIEFAQLVSKRKLHSKMDELKQEARAKAREERGRGATTSATVPRVPAKKPRTTYEAAAASRPISQQPSGSLPGAAQRAPTSYPTQGNPSTSRAAGACHGAAAPGRLVPRGSGSAHYDQGGPAVTSHGHGYEPEAAQPYAGSPSQVVALQQEEIRLLRGRVYVFEIALGVGLGGEAAARAGSLVPWSGSVRMLPRSIKKLAVSMAVWIVEPTCRLTTRCETSSLHDHAPYPEQQQPHSYQVQFGQGSYGALRMLLRCTPHRLTTSARIRRLTATRRRASRSCALLHRATHRFLRGSQSQRVMVPLKTTHVKRRVSRHRLGQVYGVRRAMPAEDREGSNEAVLQLVALDRANSV